MPSTALPDISFSCTRTSPSQGRFRIGDNTSDNKVLPLRPHRDYGSTSPPPVIRPPPLRFPERACAQAPYQANPPPSFAQEKRARRQLILRSAPLERI